MLSLSFIFAYSYLCGEEEEDKDEDEDEKEDEEEEEEEEGLSLISMVKMCIWVFSQFVLSLSLSQTRASLTFVKLSELKFHPFCLQLLVHLRRRWRRRRGTGRRRGRRRILYYER